MSFNGYSEINYVEEEPAQTDTRRTTIFITDEKCKSVCEYVGYVDNTEFKKLYSEEDLKKLAETVHKDYFEFNFNTWKNCMSQLRYDKDEDGFVLRTGLMGI